jgi:hypothetical protein
VAPSVSQVATSSSVSRQIAAVPEDGGVREPEKDATLAERRLAEPRIERATLRGEALKQLVLPDARGHRDGDAVGENVEHAAALGLA